jgi:hypothetical protein
MSNQSSDEQMLAISQRFDDLTRRVLNDFERQLQLARAENNPESVVKQQIKIEVLKAARGMYAGCYRSVTKQRPWQDEDRS